MKRKPTIHEKINFKMIGLLDHFLVTGHPTLKKWVPKNLKGKGRYNTCYDFPRPTPPLDMINEYISQKSERVRTYLKNNIHKNKYLKVAIYPSHLGTRNSFSLVKELPDNYEEVERTGSVRFIRTENVKF